MQPLVTVIIPAYNAERYLADAVTSAVNQTYDNLEVIIVDDASTDNTGALADELAKTDSRIQVIHHRENKRRSGALNTGLEQAKGAYISFLDADDWYHLDKTAAQVTFLEEHPEVAMVYGDYEHLPSPGADTKMRQALPSTEHAYERLAEAAKGGSKSIFTDGYIPGCSVLIRRHVFEHIRLDETLKNAEDLDLWLKILGAQFTCARLPIVTYVYRRHENQKSRSLERMQAALAVIEEKIGSGAYLGHKT